MPADVVYRLRGLGLSVTYESGTSSLRLTLDDTYGPFAGEKTYRSRELARRALSQGFELTGTVRRSVGRPDPLDKTLSFALTLVEAPPLSESATEAPTKGRIVFTSAGEHSFGVTLLTGTVSPAA